MSDNKTDSIPPSSKTSFTGVWSNKYAFYEDGRFELLKPFDNTIKIWSVQTDTLFIKTKENDSLQAKMVFKFINDSTLQLNHFTNNKSASTELLSLDKSFLQKFLQGHIWTLKETDGSKANALEGYLGQFIFMKTTNEFRIITCPQNVGGSYTLEGNILQMKTLKNWPCGNDDWSELEPVFKRLTSDPMIVSPNYETKEIILSDVSSKKQIAVLKTSSIGKMIIQ